MNRAIGWRVALSLDRTHVSMQAEIIHKKVAMIEVTSGFRNNIHKQIYKVWKVLLFFFFFLNTTRYTKSGQEGLQIFVSFSFDFPLFYSFICYFIYVCVSSSYCYYLNRALLVTLCKKNKITKRVTGGGGGGGGGLFFAYCVGPNSQVLGKLPRRKSYRQK